MVFGDWRRIGYWIPKQMEARGMPALEEISHSLIRRNCRILKRFVGCLAQGVCEASIRVPTCLL
jgi:hypothetical protein